jgi:hypothetical protein
MAEDQLNFLSPEYLERRQGLLLASFNENKEQFADKLSDAVLRLKSTVGVDLGIKVKLSKPTESCDRYALQLIFSQAQLVAAPIKLRGAYMHEHENSLHLEFDLDPSSPVDTSVLYFRP